MDISCLHQLTNVHTVVSLENMGFDNCNFFNFYLFTVSNSLFTLDEKRLLTLSS